MSEPRITLKGDLALMAMRWLALIEERGECVLHIDARRAGALRWRVADLGGWERPHRKEGASIDGTLR